MILKNKHKAILLQLLSQNIQKNIDVLAFGSRVNGDACNGSDLDLVIKTKDDRPLKIGELSNLKDSLDDSNIPFLVDVLDWNRIPDYFQDNILQNYEILQ